MKPAYTITNTILNAISESALILGKLQAAPGGVSAPKLRKQNQIKTIQGTLAIEGNTLNAEQISAIIEHKRVLGSASEIREVQNAIQVYSKLNDYKSISEKSFLQAHADLLKGLVPDAGRYRSKDVGVLAGRGVAHMPPGTRLVPKLMGELFSYLKSLQSEHAFIKSSVFHYELEFIHPFSDGNGRMGRLWQTLILKEYDTVFAYIPIESVIMENQADYYASLAAADKAGDCTVFIEFMVSVIIRGVTDFYQQFRPPVESAATRLAAAQLHFKNAPFKRQDLYGAF